MLRAFLDWDVMEKKTYIVDEAFHMFMFIECNSVCILLVVLTMESIAIIIIVVFTTGLGF